MVTSLPLFNMVIIMSADIFLSFFLSEVDGDTSAISTLFPPRHKHQSTRVIHHKELYIDLYFYFPPWLHLTETKEQVLSPATTKRNGSSSLEIPYTKGNDKHSFRGCSVWCCLSPSILGAGDHGPLRPLDQPSDRPASGPLIHIPQ